MAIARRFPIKPNVKAPIDALYLAASPLPFADRQHAGILATALNLGSDQVTSDFSASQQSTTGTLITALDAIKTGNRRQVLVAADVKANRSRDHMEKRT